MKEKRLEIEKRKTVEELEALNNEILGIENPKDTPEGYELVVDPINAAGVVGEEDFEVASEKPSLLELFRA